MSGWADRSDAIDALAAALVAAATELTDVHRTRTAQIPTKSGGSYGYRYADLADLLQAVRPVLAKHGLVATQTASTVGDEVAIWTTLLHQTGQFVTASALTLPAGRTAQETGSAVTYGRRYALMALLGLAADDDDGAAAAPRSTGQGRRNAGEQRNASRQASAKVEARTEAEGEIRRLLATLTGAEAKRVKDEFRAAFGSSLAELEPELHDVALTWAREAVEVVNAADAAWVEEAQS